MGASSLYAKLCVPSFSYIWHPFSVVPSVERQSNNTVRILFRARGKFTNHLRDALMHYNNSVCLECSHDTPLLLFDGFYGGEINRVKQAVDHDHIMMVAGGIGITFFLSFLPNLPTLDMSRRRLGGLHVNALSFPSSTVIAPAV
jgi:predicted ferric reductase